MSKQEIFDYFATNNANLSVRTLMITMLCGLLIGLIIYLTYWAVYRGVAYNSQFNVSLIVILLVAVVIMLMISSNIVVSLGMVGALSIVRFRTAVKDARDTVFIFWAIAEGLCVGSQNMKIALVTTLCIAIVLIFTSFLPAMNRRYLLIVRGGVPVIDTMEVSRAMRPYVRDSQLRSAARAETHQELIYEIKVKRQLGSKLLDAVSGVDGVTGVNWISESGENMG